MGVRGEQYRDSIRAVVDVFGSGAKDFVFIGSCVLGLYMRPAGGPFRQTIDADVVSMVKPWSLQAKFLADLCSQGILHPDERLTCRYHIAGKNISVDVLSPEGKNMGNITEWFLRAVEHPRAFCLDDGSRINAVSPPFFLALKLEAWADRGEDAMTDKDAEDIVGVATEVLDLTDQVRSENIGPGIRDLWKLALEKHSLTTEDIPELVSYHLHPIDRAEEERVVASLMRCARGV